MPPSGGPYRKMIRYEKNQSYNLLFYEGVMAVDHKTFVVLSMISEHDVQV